MANGNASRSVLQVSLNWIYWAICRGCVCVFFCFPVAISSSGNNRMQFLLCRAKQHSVFFSFKWKIYAWRCVNCHSMLGIMLRCMYGRANVLHFCLLLSVQFALRLYYLQSGHALYLVLRYINVNVIALVHPHGMKEWKKTYHPHQ